MKDRVLKLWEEQGAKEYAEVWQKGTRTYEDPVERKGYCNEWNYYDWSGVTIHHNIETDKMVVFVDNKMWKE